MKRLFQTDTWQEIYHSLRNNKFRTFLTMIGVGWGMFLYVSLLGAAKGMENGFNKIFDGFATNSIFLWAQNTSIPYDGYPKGRNLNLKVNDLDLLQSKIKGIDYIAPRNQKGNFGTQPILFTQGKNKGNFSVFGDFPIGDAIMKKDLVFGRNINASDQNNSKNVCVLGKEVYEKLFEKNENPIGRTVSIQGTFFTVIGVFKLPKNSGVLENDASVFIPFSSFAKLFNNGNNVDVFCIVGQPNVNLSLLDNEIKDQLKKINNVSPEDTNAFGSFNLGKEFKKLTGFLSGMQLLTIIVGTLTIIAGVIAISNILLITVKERTKEIGIRRALGAKPSEVRNQILLESVVITLTSGIIGFILGLFLLMIINQFTKNAEGFPFYNPTVDYTSISMALFIMVFLGLLIGLIPAQRAVMIKPIEALRSE